MSNRLVKFHSSHGSPQMVFSPLKYKFLTKNGVKIQKRTSRKFRQKNLLKLSASMIKTDRKLIGTNLKHGVQINMDFIILPLPDHFP